METLKPPTQQNVAKKAGVSTSTVSRVLNNNPAVDPQIRDRVREVLEELNYKRIKNKYGRKVKGTFIIGLIIPDILNPFFPLLIKGIENIAKIHGYSIILCDSENEVEIEKKHVKNLLNRGIEGLIFIPTSEFNDYINDLICDNFPLVFLDRKVDHEKINVVTSANEEGAYQAVKYLIRLGHRDIIYIAGPRYLSTEKARFSGFEKAMIEENLLVNKNLILQGDHSWDKAFSEVIRLIKMKVSFTAIFATSDIMAFGAKQALELHDLKIPDDISIIGYDDLPFSSAISLTTVAQPAYEMGKNAMLLIIDLIKERILPPYEIVLRPSMIIRNSCKKR